MAHIILKFTKMKGNPTGNYEKHRQSNFCDCNIENINYHILKPNKPYYEEINNRIEKSGCRVRSSSIKFVDTLITASTDFFNAYSIEEVKTYFKMTVDFLISKLGKDNIFLAVVHISLNKSTHNKI